MKKLLIIGFLVLVLAIACEQSNPVVTENENISGGKVIHSLSKINSNALIVGPKVFTRSKGKPTIEEIEFTVEGNFLNTQLILTNGGAQKKTRVTSCFVLLNSDTLIYPIDLDKEIDSIKVDVVLNQENLLQVKFAGKPGSYCTIQIEGEQDCPCSIIDIDGNTYETIKIGNQCWIAENLKVTHYRNGDPIPYVTTNSNWNDLNTGAYCAYDHDESNADIYGYIYNWYAIQDSRNIAPEGWHVATDEDWKELEMYLGMSQEEADALMRFRGTNQGSKLAGNAPLWRNGPLKESYVFGTTGFSAVPGGNRVQPSAVGGGGRFNAIGDNITIWTGSEYNTNDAWCRHITYA